MGTFIRSYTYGNLEFKSSALKWRGLGLKQSNLWDTHLTLTASFPFPGAILSPRWCLAIPGDIFGCHKSGEGATGNWQVEDRDAAKILHCSGQSPKQRTIWPNVSIVLRLRNCHMLSHYLKYKRGLKEPPKLYPCLYYTNLSELHTLNTSFTRNRT